MNQLIGQISALVIIGVAVALLLRMISVEQALGFIGRIVLVIVLTLLGVSIIKGLLFEMLPRLWSEMKPALTWFAVSVLLGVVLIVVFQVVLRARDR